MNKINVTTKACLALAFAAGLFIAHGCIKDDIPYPRIQPNILSLTVENALQATSIDSMNRVATVYLSEEADIYNVSVTDCSITPGASFVGESIEGILDLSSPNYFMLRLYQDYVWTVKAQQTIERYFTVASQIGSSVIDVPGRRVVVTLPESVDLSKVNVLTAKLGSVNSVITPALEGETVSLKNPLKVEVSDYGRTAEWTIYADVTQSTVTTVRVDAWTNVAWVYGEAQEGKDNTVQYRRADVSDWTTVPEDWLTVNGGSFYARLVHLEADADYVARAISDDEAGEEITFHTGDAIQVPDSGFDNWWLDGKVWCPWAQDGTKYWDTGNRGATTLGSSNTTPTDDTYSGTGQAAMLETKFVGIGVVGKLAAGNIFAGSYIRTDGTNGILSFGREFTQRPTKMRGYLKYHSAPISSVTSGFEDIKNQPDTCIIWVALIDSDQPFEIRTNPNNRQLFDPDGSEVIAYGDVQYGYDVSQYTPFEIDIEYKATNREPKYILIVASASKYGDYFTGGNGSVLYLDETELLYDY